MPSSDHSRFPWFPNFLTARERFVAIVLAIVVSLLIWWHERLPLSWSVFLWALVLAIGAGLLARRWWSQFFGPVFFYDLVRTARRGQQIAHRCLYAGLLFLVLLLVFWSWLPSFSLDLDSLFRAVSLASGDRTRFAESFFAAFMLLQFAVVLIVTPAYTAGAIAEEKERRTLEFLLVTDLSNREIVLGMMSSRLANLGLLVLTGLPILSLLEFLGGVSPEMVLAGFVGTGLTIVSLGSVSILVSVNARTALAAVLTTYGWMFVILAGFTCLSPCFGLYNLLWFAGLGLGGSMFMTQFLAGWLLAYLLCHGAVTFVCCRAAIVQLRKAALGTRERSRPPYNPYLPPARPKPVPPRPVDCQEGWVVFPTQEDEPALPRRRPLPPIPRHRYCPPVGDDGLLWKELYTGHSTGFPNFRDLAALLIVVLIAAIIFGIVALLIGVETGESVGNFTNRLVRWLAVPYSCFLFFMVALSAARRVSREREQQTLDSLLTIPQDSDAILFAKWLASLLSASGWAWFLPVLWCFGLVTGGVHPFALPLLVGAGIVYGTFMASLGLWFSTVSRTSLRATLFTVLAALVVLIGPGFLAKMLAGGSSARRSPQDPVVWGALFVDYGLSPSTTLWVLTFRSGDLVKGNDVEPLGKVLAAVAGLYCYLAASVLLWLSASRRLHAEKGPAPRRRPPESSSASPGDTDRSGDNSPRLY